MPGTFKGRTTRSDPLAGEFFSHRRPISQGQMMKYRLHVERASGNYEPPITKEETIERDLITFRVSFKCSLQPKVTTSHSFSTKLSQRGDCGGGALCKMFHLQA